VTGNNTNLIKVGKGRRVQQKGKNTKMSVRHTFNTDVKDRSKLWGRNLGHRLEKIKAGDFKKHAKGPVGGIGRGSPVKLAVFENA